MVLAVRWDNFQLGLLDMHLHWHKFTGMFPWRTCKSCLILSLRENHSATRQGKIQITIQILVRGWVCIRRQNPNNYSIVTKLYSYWISITYADTRPSLLKSQVAAVCSFLAQAFLSLSCSWPALVRTPRPLPRCPCPHRHRAPRLCLGENSSRTIFVFFLPNKFIGSFS